MSNSGGFTLTRTRSGDCFYNQPPVRYQRLLLQKRQQEQLQRLEPEHENHHIYLAELEESISTESNNSTFSSPDSVRLDSPPTSPTLTNLDRLLESVTPVVPALYAEATSGRCGTCEVDVTPFFSLGDLWASFEKWSVYGVGVPLILNGSDSVKQYYVPSLSGMQIYIDPQKLKGLSKDCKTESCREMSSVGSNDCEKKTSLHNIMNWKHDMLKEPVLKDKPTTNSPIDENEVPSSPGIPVFEYLEQEQPHNRKPLYEKVSAITSQFPEIRMYRSCDLLPASWISVAWYPIYRIPMGPTLQNIDASFLTIHSLSTHTKSNGHIRFHNSSERKSCFCENAFSQFSLPVFGLASYKLKGSILASNGGDELVDQANSLMQAAENWLRPLHVNLPDFQFFASHLNSCK